LTRSDAADAGLPTTSCRCFGSQRISIETRRRQRVTLAALAEAYFAIIRLSKSTTVLQLPGRGVSDILEKMGGSHGLSCAIPRHYFGRSSFLGCPRVAWSDSHRVPACGGWQWWMIGGTI